MHSGLIYVHHALPNDVYNFLKDCGTLTLSYDWTCTLNR